MASKSRKKPSNGKREEYRKMETILGLSTFIHVVNMLIFAARPDESAKTPLILAGVALYLSLSNICEKSIRNRDWGYYLFLSILILIPATLLEILDGYYTFAWVFVPELLIFGLFTFLLLKKPSKKKKE